MDFEEFVVSEYRGYKSESRTLRHHDPEAETVVLIGGAFQRKTAWGRLEVALAETFHVVTVDLPGWGDADTLPASYGVDFLTESLHALLGAAGHRRLDVFGGSYGAAIAYRYAQTHPEAVRRLVVVGPVSRIPERVREAMRQSLDLLDNGRMDEFADLGTHMLLSAEPGARVARRSAVHRILHRLFRDIGDSDREKYRNNTLRLLEQGLPSPTPRVAAPVLVATGEHDAFTPPELCREFALGCPGALFTVLRDADHAIHLEVPDQLADLLTRFFTGQSLAGLAYCHPVEYPVRPPLPSALVTVPRPAPAGWSASSLLSSGAEPRPAVGW
ncbi:alpha/beta fold hydrolase [Streptacidiphilus sp. EB129]|uniref:alpha/beta fold hydrolase n=1 Tax=Streptacidiphilus sp. EB129 TaxID=3156262 RepID=UPI003515416B